MDMRGPVAAFSAVQDESQRSTGAQVRAGIPPLEGQRKAALFELATLQGRAPARAPMEVQACVRPPQLDALIPVGDGVELLRRRPDVRQAERRVAAATARVGVATTDLYPRISITGFFGGVSAALPDLTTNDARAWGVGPSIKWNFPNQAGIPRACATSQSQHERSARRLRCRGIAGC
jgi:outer membrane protein TolC